MTFSDLEEFVDGTVLGVRNSRAGGSVCHSLDGISSRGGGELLKLFLATKITAELVRKGW